MARKTLNDYMSNPNANFQVMSKSIKVTDNNGKLLGIVTNTIRMDALQSKMKFDAVQKLSRAGISNDASTQKNFLVNGNDVYGIKDGKILTLDDYKKATSIESSRGVGGTSTSNT